MSVLKGHTVNFELISIDFGLAFLVSPILSKNEHENSNFCPSLLGQQIFVRFLGELKKQTNILTCPKLVCTPV